MVQQQWQKGARAISITEQKISADGKAFPFAIEPENRDLKKEEMVEWAKRNRDSLALELREQGAILFRGFPIQSAEDFSDFVEALGIESLPYVGGAAVRYRVFKEVHTTNESPPDAKIPFHHEMAQGISLSNHSSTLPGMSLFSMPANHQRYFAC